MTEKKKSDYLMLTIISILLAWFLYSFLFYQTYNEAKIFATEGAQPIVQMLEILNYRGEQFLPYFISFFTLTSLSFLYITYLFIFIKKYKLKNYLLILINIIILILIGINITNKFLIFWLFLVVMSLLVIVSITLTIKYLYTGNEIYELGDIVKINGPFKEESEAQIYAEKELIQLKNNQKFKNIDLSSVVYLEKTNQFYVDFYIDNIKTDRESDAYNEKKNN